MSVFSARAGLALPYLSFLCWFGALNNDLLCENTQQSCHNWEGNGWCHIDRVNVIWSG